MADFITIIPQSTFNDTQKLLKDVNAIADAVERVNNEAKQIKFPSEARRVIEKTNEGITKTNKLLTDTEKIREKQRLQDLKLQKDREMAFDKFEKNLQKEKRAREKQVNAEATFRERLRVQREREERQTQKTIEQEKRAREKQVNAEAAFRERLRVQREREERQTKKTIEQNKRLARAFVKLNKRRTEASNKLKDLIASENASNREIRRAQLEFNKLDKRVRRANKAVRDGRMDVGRYTLALGKARINALRFASALGFTGILFGIARGFQEAIRTIREFDEQLIAVGKTTGLQGEELENLAEKTIALGLRLKGISIKGLLETAEVAGQLGIKGTESILAFSEAVEKLRITSDVASEETIRDFAKFIEVSSDTAENADRLGSVITRLGNNFATTETAIISNATEIQKGIAIFNTSAESVLGLGAATNALGSEAEASRTAIQKTFIVIEKAINTGEGLQDILRLTGLTQKELSDQFNRDATGVFVKFIKGLSDINKTGGSVTQQLGKLQLSNVRVNTVIGALSKNYDVLNSAVSQANQEYIDNTAANEEVEAATKSLNSIIGDLKDSWDAFILSIDKGDGVISKFIRTTAQDLTDFVNGLIQLNTTATEKGVKAADSIVNAFKKSSKSTSKETTDFIREQIGEAEKNIEQLQQKLDKVSKKSISNPLVAFGIVEGAADKVKNQLQENIAARERLQNLLFKEQEAREDLARTATKLVVESNKEKGREIDAEKQLAEFRKLSTFQLNKIISINENLINSKKKLNDENKDDADNEKKKMKATAGSVAALKEQIKNLKELRDKTALTNDEFKEFNIRIEALERLIAVIDGTTEAFEDFNGEGLETKKIVSDLVDGWDEYAGRKNEERLKRERDALEELKNATTDFLNIFVDDVFQEAGLQSLQIFFDLDEQGQSTFDKLIAGARQTGNEFAVTFNAIAEVAQQAFGFIEQVQAASIQKQLNDLNTQKEIELALNEGNAEAIAMINEQAAAQEAEIKQKQARQNKQTALFNIAVNTAQGIVAALASVPPNIPLSITIGVIGALQAGLVAATPIPAFKDGVRDFEGGLAIVGDGGVPEVVSMPDKGHFVTPATPTLVNLPKGSDVIPSLREFDANLNKILLSNRIEPIRRKSNSITANQMDAIFARNMKKMTALNLNIDQNGFGLSVQRGLSKTNVHRNRIIFKGKKV